MLRRNSSLGLWVVVGDSEGRTLGFVVSVVSHSQNLWALICLVPCQVHYCPYVMHDSDLVRQVSGRVTVVASGCHCSQ